MTSAQLRRIVALTTQLSEALMTAALCADELRTIARAELDDPPLRIPGAEAFRPDRAAASKKERPILDESTMCVVWKGGALHLGHTVAFRFLQRLARCPNQYVTHLTLLHDVWENEELALATIRSVVRNLRSKLRDGGMNELAAAIRGHNGRYILSLA